MTGADQVASLFLTDIGAPQTPGNVAAVKVWLAAENSNPTLRNNPWNLHSSGGLPGQTGSAYVGPGDRNVAIFGTLAAGVAANAHNLTALAGTYPTYGSAVLALQSNNPVGFLTQIAASPWSAGHYRTKSGANSLLQQYNGTNVPVLGGGTSVTPHASATGQVTIAGNSSPSASAIARAFSAFEAGPLSGVGAPSGSTLAGPIGAGGLASWTAAHPVLWLLLGALVLTLVLR